MITQEMVDAALQADMEKRIWLQARSTSYAPADKAKMQMEVALTAVYPLILEQAARVCDYQIEFFKGDGVLAGKCCARAIRNLKDKTDEANNG